MPLPGPSCTSLPSLSGSSTVGGTVSCSNGTWSDFGGSINRFTYQWFRNGGAIGGATGSSYVLTDADDGQSVNCQVTAWDDGQGLNGTATSSNSDSPHEPAPTFNSVSISGTPKVGSTLSASASINNMGGAGGSSYGFTWYRNGSAVTTGSSYGLTPSDDGCTITVSCSASNTGGSASCSSSGGVGVTYPAPSNTAAPAVTGSAITGQTLTCNGGSWSTTVSLAYQWQRDNSGGGVYSSIGGATGSTYVPVSADVGCHVRCAVTATNDGGSAAANSNSTALVTGAPVNSVAPAVTGTPKVGQTLTSTQGTWLYSPTSYAYQWQRDNQGDGNFGSITGATSSTYVLTTSDTGCQVQCVVIATNANGNGQASSNASPRTQQPPALVAAPKVTDPNIFATGTATCDGGTWSAYPAVTISYQWQSSPDGSTWTNITGATSVTYTIPRALIGSYVRCQVSADNGVT